MEVSSGPGGKRWISGQAENGGSRDRRKTVDPGTVGTKVDPGPGGTKVDPGPGGKKGRSQGMTSKIPPIFTQELVKEALLRCHTLDSKENQSCISNCCNIKTLFEYSVILHLKITGTVR